MYRDDRWGVKDKRVQTLMPDVLHWLGIAREEGRQSGVDERHEVRRDREERDTNLKATISYHPIRVRRSTPRLQRGTFRAGHRSRMPISSRR
ncbi:hypothetical protein BDZ97DRAFT_1833308 [Flammula alnicola]|nr:hypothetical protein BDZ97DRAFT_1833308 [Flammula alnicola]